MTATKQQPIAGYRISDPSDPTIKPWLSETPDDNGYTSEPLYAGAAPAAVAPQGVVAWMTPEGDRVVTAETMDGARKDGGASLSSLRPYTVALVRGAVAPAQEAPAAVDFAMAYGGRRVPAYGKRGDPVLLYPDDLVRMLAAATQASTAPSAIATQVIENLLQLARIVNTAVEDWGESFEDGSSEVTFHKEEADKLEEILEFFDSLPDAPESEGVILSGPNRAQRVLRAQAAPAAPAVDAPSKVLSQAARDVLAERRRQVEAEGWTSEHDDQHDEGEMCFAAAGYAAVASDNLQAISRGIDRDLTLDDNVYPPTNYPWPRSWEFKPCTPRRALVKAGALILAEIERIDRCSPDAAQAAAKGEHDD
ncbi:hypothetical protein [Delftia sp. CH05]|uniref:hypothetical protein n=1 Tax=Delftia sp. CH05 TaxID=2692194 RepID=UPI00135E1916|nr:hypothetical protein [Delftia sp. CH05]MXN28738.1 hypothetical protein [Delftia sp. CH05]